MLIHQLWWLAGSQASAADSERNMTIKVTRGCGNDDVLRFYVPFNII